MVCCVKWAARKEIRMFVSKKEASGKAGVVKTRVDVVLKGEDTSAAAAGRQEERMKRPCRAAWTESAQDLTDSSRWGWRVARLWC